MTQDELERRREIVRQKHLERKEAEKIKQIDAQAAAQNDTPEPAKIENDSVVNSETKTQEDEEDTFVAFARVFSGTIRKGQKMYVLGPKYDPAKGLVLDKTDASLDSVDFDLINR